MKNSLEFGSHETFLYKTNPSDIIYGVIISNAFIYVGNYFQEFVMVIVGLITSLATLIISIRLVRPEKIIIASDKMLIPNILPGQGTILRSQDVKGYVVRRRKFQEYIFIVMKSGKVHELKVNYIQNWPRYFDLMSAKYPSLATTQPQAPSIRNLILIAGFFIAVVIGATKQGYIDEEMSKILMVIIPILCFLPLIKKTSS